MEFEPSSVSFAPSNARPCVNTLALLTDSALRSLGLYGGSMELGWSCDEETITRLPGNTLFFKEDMLGWFH